MLLTVAALANNLRIVAPHDDPRTMHRKSIGIQCAAGNDPVCVRALPSVFSFDLPSPTQEVSQEVICCGGCGARSRDNKRSFFG